MGLLGSCLPRGSSTCAATSALLPAAQRHLLDVFSFFPFPNQCLTWMALFSDSFKADTSAIVYWFGFLASRLPFHLSPPFSPVIHCLLVWCSAPLAWGDAEGLVPLRVLTGMDIAFHHPLCKQAYGPEWDGINTCQVLSYSLLGLWAASEINLCRSDISPATPKGANGFATLPRALEMKRWALRLLK